MKVGDSVKVVDDRYGSNCKQFIGRTGVITDVYPIWRSSPKFHGEWFVRLEFEPTDLIFTTEELEVIPENTSHYEYTGS